MVLQSKNDLRFLFTTMNKTVKTHLLRFSTFNT